MKLNYAIFRSEPIFNLKDLSAIGSHNKRSKKAYISNPDIQLEKIKDNIEIVPLAESYVKDFYLLTDDYKKEHDLKMETTREDRKRTFREAVDNSKNVVADELLFTSTNDFFKDMNKEDILKWADTCMEFVYKDLNYKESQVLHSVLHLDEKTPHIHCVVVPLVKKYDKRTNAERFTISKKQYIKDKNHLSELQDKYHKRLVDKGFDLERGIKNSDVEHLNIKEYKTVTRKINNEISVRNDKLTKSLAVLDDKMLTNKETIFDKEYVKVKKDTFDSMKKVINETKKVAEIKPKIEYLFTEIENYSDSNIKLQKNNDYYQKEIKSLKNKNKRLEDKNENLLYYINSLYKRFKEFLRQILKYGNNYSKNLATSEIKEFYDDEEFNKEDVIDISIDTTKEDDLFDYIGLDIDKNKDCSFTL